MVVYKEVDHFSWSKKWEKKLLLQTAMQTSLHKKFQRKKTLISPYEKTVNGYNNRETFFNFTQDHQAAQNCLFYGNAIKKDVRKGLRRVKLV